MKTFLIVACTVSVLAACGVALFFALHILNDPMNTGYLHIGAVTVLPLAAALIGYAFPRED